MRIIAFTGVAHSGKSSAAEIVKDALETRDGMRARIFHFATPLKSVADAIWEPVLGDVWTTAKKESKLPIFGVDGQALTKRKAYQELGDGYGRKLHPNLWVEHLQKEIDSSFCQYAILDNLRYLNEADWVLHCGGSLYRLRRLEKELLLSTETWRHHPSELECLTSDMGKLAMDIESDGTLEELGEKLRAIVAEDFHDA